MKILMQGKLELFSSGGGDKVQIDNTAKELRKLGIEVEIHNTWHVDYSKYDLVHIFQLDWMPETWFYAKYAKKANKPVVISPIHHNFEEVKKFDDDYAFDFRRISRILFKNQFHRDTFKNVYKSIFFPKKIIPTIYSVFYGFERMLKETIALSDHVLVQTSLEAKDLENIFGMNKPWTKIPNGVGKHFFETSPNDNIFDFNNYVVCIGRIEARKNQLNIIKAFEKVREALKEESIEPPNLVFVGKKSWPKHAEYVWRFDGMLKRHTWIKYVEEVPYEKMPSIYKYAKVCASASWFESTGLTSLEALFCKTNAVASGEQAKEYLGDYASYCLPNDVDSIAEAILKEYLAERPEIPTEMKKEYTWENAAIKTLEVYKEYI